MGFPMGFPPAFHHENHHPIFSGAEPPSPECLAFTSSAAPSGISGSSVGNGWSLRAPKNHRVMGKVMGKFSWL